MEDDLKIVLKIVDCQAGGRTKQFIHYSKIKQKIWKTNMKIHLELKHINPDLNILNGTIFDFNSFCFIFFKCNSHACFSSGNRTTYVNFCNRMKYGNFST